MCNSKNNSTPESWNSGKKSKPLYDSRCDETSVAVACATAATARGASCINYRAEAATEPDCCLENPLRVIIGNVIASQGLILPTLQIINRSIDQLAMMFAEYIWGFIHN